MHDRVSTGAIQARKMVERLYDSSGLLVRKEEFLLPAVIDSLFISRTHALPSFDLLSSAGGSMT